MCYRRARRERYAGQIADSIDHQHVRKAASMRINLLVLTALTALATTQPAKALDKVNGITSEPLPLNPDGTTGNATVDGALDLIECLDTNSPVPPGMPSRTEQLQSMLANGQVFEITGTADQPREVTGTSEGANIAVSTTEPVVDSAGNTQRVARTPASVAGTLLHELDHANHTPPGQDHDSRTDPDQMPPGLSDREKASRAHSAHSQLHKDTLDNLCAIAANCLPPGEQIDCADLAKAFFLAWDLAKLSSQTGDNLTTEYILTLVMLRNELSSGTLCNCKK